MVVLGACLPNNKKKEKAMGTNNSLQEAFLTELCKGKVPVSVFLVNGIKLHGVIDAYDNSVLTLKNSITQMVFKTAISTIVPSRLIHIPPSE
jgi:host factor-I protein